MSFSAESAPPEPAARSDSTLAGVTGIRAEDLTLAEVQHLVELAVRAYGRIVDAEGGAGPILALSHAVTATDAVRAAGALLAALNVEVFELALFQTWGGSPWSRHPTNTLPTTTLPNGQNSEDSHA